MIHKTAKKHTKTEILSQLDPVIQEWFNSKFSDLTPPQAYAIPLIHDENNVLIASPTGSGKTLTAFLTLINKLFTLGKSNMLENQVYCVYISPLKALANDIERNLNQPLMEIYELAEQKGIELPKIRVGVRSGDTSAYDKQKMVKKPPHILITTPETLAIVLSTTRFRDNLRSVRYVIVDEIHEVCNSKRGVNLSVSLERLQYLVSSSALEKTIEEERERGGEGETEAETETDAEKPIADSMKRDSSNSFLGPESSSSSNGGPFSAREPENLKDSEDAAGSRGEGEWGGPGSGPRAPGNGLRVTGSELIRIGLSATQAPIAEIARYLVGYRGGKLRDVHIIEALFGKQLDLKVLCPVQDMNLVPFEIVNAKMYNQLTDMINSHRTTLVFTNTRSGTETVVFKLNERGIDNVAAHHGSLSKETRLDVENRLKNGELDATITSTSLELGIDIGYIDLVCQIGSPKSIAKGLQRIGRAGHALHEISKGRLIVFDRDDLVECTVLVKSAYDGNVDRLSIPVNSLDVLSQVLIGMSLEQRWNENDAFELIKNSYCFHKLTRRDFRKVLSFVGGRHSLETSGVYGKIWYDPADAAFGIRRGSRLIYNLNVGTIPQETAYKVILFGAGMSLGSLSEKFVERLSKGDVFILGGKTYEFIQCKGMKVLVKDAHGRKPTVPSWSGEMMPRSFDLSRSIGRFRSHLAARLRSSKDDGEAAMAWLSAEYFTDEGSSRTIVNYVKEQLGLNPQLPTDKNVVIEGYVDARGFKNVIFHYCYGRRVNDALSRAYAYALSKKHKCTVRISLTDDNFMLTLPKRVRLEGLEKLVTSDNLVELLKHAIRNTELFKQRFRHTAVRSFMILRNYKGKEISIRKQHYRAQRVLDMLNTEAAESVPAAKQKRGSAQSKSDSEELPVMMETYNEIMHEAMDIENALWVIAGLESGKITVTYSRYSNIPSPFAHNVVLMGISDIVLMEDRSALLRELHKQVLAKVVSKQELSASKFELERVEEYFRRKVKEVRSKRDIIPLLKSLGPMRLFVEKGRNIFTHSSVNRRTLMKWCRELVNEGEITSIVRNDTLWLPASELPIYYSVYGKPLRLSPSLNELIGQIASETLSAKLDKSEFDDLRRLERHFVVYRDRVESYGKHHFAQRDIKKLKDAAPPYDAALDSLIINHLEYNGASTIAEVSFELDIDEELTGKILSELEDRSITTSGNFVLGKDLPQFLLLKDMLKLELVAAREAGDDTQVGAKKELVMDRDVYMAFLQKREFTQVASIDEYFDRYTVAYHERDVFLRVKNFDIKTWQKMLRSGELIQGRFQAGRVCFIRRTDAPPCVHLYRQADLNAVDQTVLDLINSKVDSQYTEVFDNDPSLSSSKKIPADMECEGVSRSELISALNMRENDVVDALEKLDYNLYIARSKRDIREYGTVNRYIPLDAGPIPENAAETVIMQLISGYGPVPFSVLRASSRLPSEILKTLLQNLVDEGKLFKFVVIGEVLMEVYADYEMRSSLMRFNNDYARKKKKVADSSTREFRILTATDPFARRFELELRSRYGDEWHSSIFENTRPRGAIQLWKLASCVEIRDIVIDPGLSEDEKARVLDGALKEFDNMMRFYEMYGLDILKITTVENQPAAEAPAYLKQVLKDNGYNFIQDFYVKGKVLPISFNKRDIFNFVFFNQQVHPGRHFEDPMEIIRKFGGVRSTFEMYLRLNGRAYDLKEYRRHHDLAAGQMIPEFFMYCTQEDAGLYKTAKGRELDDQMEHILSHIYDSTPIKPQELRDRSNLSDSTFKKALKKLHEGLFVIKTPINYYQKLEEDEDELDRNAARKLVLRRIIDNFGIFTAEGLSAFLKRGFAMEELRSLLRELEAEDVLAKGYLIKDSPDLYWITKGAEKKIRRLPKMKDRFVLSNQDQLNHYLIEDIRQKFGIGSCYVIFDGTEMTGAFKAQKRSNRLIVTEFIGDSDDWTTVRMFANRHKLELIDEEEAELYDYDE